MKSKLLVLVCIVVALLVYLPETVLANESDMGYKVNPGECMIVIGEKLGLDWQDLAEKNNIYAPRYKVIAGAVLKTEGVAKARSKKTAPSKQEEKSEAFAVSENDALHESGSIEKRTLHVYEKSKRLNDDGGLLSHEFQRNSRENKVFQKAMKDFVDNEEEANLFAMKIDHGDMSWGYFRNGDKCNVIIDKQGGVHNGKLRWKKGRDATALEAADVYESPSGKQIWFLLSGGTICLKDENTVDTALSRVEGVRPVNTERGSGQPKPESFVDRFGYLWKKEKTVNLFDSEFLRREFGGNKLKPNNLRSIRDFPKSSDGIRHNFPQANDGTPSKKRIGLEDIFRGFAKEGMLDSSRKTLDQMLWTASRLPQNEPMDILVRKEIQKMFPIPSPYKETDVIQKLRR